MAQKHPWTQPPWLKWIEDCKILPSTTEAVIVVVPDDAAQRFWSQLEPCAVLYGYVRSLYPDTRSLLITNGSIYSAVDEGLLEVEHVRFSTSVKKKGLE